MMQYCCCRHRLVLLIIQIHQFGIIFKVRHSSQSQEELRHFQGNPLGKSKGRDGKNEFSLQFEFRVNLSCETRQYTTSF